MMRNPRYATGLLVLVMAIWAGASQAASRVRQVSEHPGCPAAPQPGRDWISPSTGMEFVWIDALSLWAGRYEVTFDEYRMNDPLTPPAVLEGVVLHGGRQPAVFVRFDEAAAYADWMTERDRDHGALCHRYAYRLPTGGEWEALARCGDDRTYPWGNEWPPPSGRAGNYADEAARRQFPDFEIIEGYDDGAAAAAPVETLWRNPWGLHGVGGNVWEVTTCEDGNYDAWRGASWHGYIEEYLRISGRFEPEPSISFISGGFRLLLAPCDEPDASVVESKE